MQIEIIGRDYEITESIKNIILDKLGFIEDFTNEKVLLVISKEGDANELRLSTKMYGQNIDITEIHYDFYEGIDLLKDKVFNKISKRKEIEIDRRRKETRKMKKQQNIPVKKVEISNQEQIRRKHIPLKPMMVEEAVLQMNMLGFRFFVFLNGETMEENIVYIHYDDNYRLLILKSEHEHSTDNLTKTTVPAFISKVKSIPVYEMDKIEALEELKANDFPFYPYFDIDTNSIGVISKERKRNKGYATINIMLS